MTFYADESVDGQIVERLRADGWHVEYVAELAAGIGDEQVLANSRDGGHVLLTADKDFGELVFRRFQDSPGVILIRLEGISPCTKPRWSRRRSPRMRTRFGARSAS